MDTTNITANMITATWFIESKEFLNHWQSHRRVTRRVIEAFPADKLFDYSIGGMRPFSDMVNEIISMSGAGVKGIATDDWVTVGELDHHTGANEANSKEGLLKQWDKVTEDINFFWPQISKDRFGEVVLPSVSMKEKLMGLFSILSTTRFITGHRKLFTCAV